MKVLLFGATGMVGQGVLRECLRATEVTEIVSVSRSSVADSPATTGLSTEKLHEVLRTDFSDLSDLDFKGLDACFFCLGVSSIGMSEADYRRITYDFALAAAEPFAAQNPEATFIYVSGSGTSAGSRQMWSRVKAAAESAIAALPLRAIMFRPGFIQPQDGIKSKTKWANRLYRVTAPLHPLLKRVAPSAMTTTANLGRAMINASDPDLDIDVKKINTNRDIEVLARQPKSRATP